MLKTTKIKDYQNRKVPKITLKHKSIILLMNIIIISFLHYYSKKLYIFFEKKNYTKSLADSFKYFQKLYLITILLFINIFYIILYKFKIPFFEKFKSNDSPWPWEENPKKFKKDIKKIIFLYLFNLVIISNFFIYFIGRFLKCRNDNNYPSLFETFICVHIFILFEDFGFYWNHRILHLPFLYSKIHKVHHSNYNVFHITSVYVHPLEHCIGNLMPSFIGALVFGPYFHFISFSVFLGYRLLKTHEAHGGYDLIYSLFRLFPKSVGANFHDFHHLKNVGNYGSFLSFWDDMFGTSKYYFEKCG